MTTEAKVKEEKPTVEETSTPHGLVIKDKNSIVGQDEVKTQLEIAVKHNYPVLLVGDTGTGKTSIVREMAVDSKNNWVRFNLTGETTVDEFVGKYTLKNGNTEWVDGILLQAMKKGQWLIVDEVNVALPEILFVLHSLLDDDKFVVVAQKDGEVVRPHANFRFFATMNPVDEYAGTKDLNKAFKSRFNMIINMQYPDVDTEVEIVKQKCNLPEEIARRIVDTGQRIRIAKAANEIFYTCSTRDLIQWGNLAAVMEATEAFKLAILNKANGDGQRVAAIYSEVSGQYFDLEQRGYKPSIDYFNDEAKKLEKKRRDFNKRKQTIRDEIRKEMVETILGGGSNNTKTVEEGDVVTEEEVNF